MAQRILKNDNSTIGILVDDITFNLADINAKVDNITVSNLLNPDTITDNKFIDGASLTDNTDYWVSDFIPVTANSNYSSNKSFTFVAFYNWDKIFISHIPAVGQTSAITPTGTLFLKLCFHKQDATPTGDVMFESGIVSHQYVPYGSPVEIKRITTYPEYKAHIDKYHEISITEQEITVKNGGTIGVDCDFTDIKSAIDSVVNNDVNNRYNIFLLNGTYDVSNDGNLFLGLKNYVNIVGQSRDGVKIIKRETIYTVDKSTFDPIYYNQEINYVAIKNVTIISKNTKCPVHCDTDVVGSSFLMELINVNLINENTSEQGNYQNSLALGLRLGQNVVCRNVYSNGMLWMHNSPVDYTTNKNGCTLKLYNCIAPWVQIGDLISYANDLLVMQGCKVKYLRLFYYKNYPSAADGHLRSYRTPSFSFEMSGNEIDYITADTTEIGVADYPSPSAIDELYSGKWGITDGSIHNYCKNVSGVTIPRFTLVTLDSDNDTNGVKAWAPGDKLYGQSLDSILSDDFGTIQYNGVLFLSADGTTPIAFNDPVELNSSGIAEKRSSGIIIGYAMQALSIGTGIIQVKLI